MHIGSETEWETGLGAHLCGCVRMLQTESVAEAKRLHELLCACIRVCVCVCARMRFSFHDKSSFGRVEFSLDGIATDLNTRAREHGLEAGGVDESTRQRPADVEYGAVVIVIVIVGGGIGAVVEERGHRFESRAYGRGAKRV